MRIVPHPISHEVASVGAWMPVRLGLVAQKHPALEAWRAAHKACVDHLKNLEACCGFALCPDGQALWDAADDAERALPWRVKP